MFDSSVLNIVIGLSLIYLLYSLFATALQEAVVTFRQRRARMLFRGIRSMLSNTPEREISLWEFLREKLSRGKKQPATQSEVDERRRVENINDPSLSPAQRRALQQTDQANATLRLYNLFYNHPIIKSFGQNYLFRKPSYITDTTFSELLVDVLKDLDDQNGGKMATFSMVKEALEKHEQKIEAEVVKILRFHLNEAAGDLNAFRFRVERWFNETMDRVSGWYKRTTQFWLFGIGILLAIAFNIDSIEITRKLSVDKKAAEQLAKMGEAIASNKNYSGRDSVLQDEIVDSIKANLNTVNTIVGLGWADVARVDTTYRRKLLESEDNRIKYDTAKQKAIKFYQNALQLLRAPLPPDADSNQRKIADKKIQKFAADSATTVNNKLLEIFFHDNGKFDFRYVFYSIGNKPTKMLGFFITAIALSLGAPFWFDLLNKFVNIRGGGKVVDSSGSASKNNTSTATTIDG